MAAKHHHRRMLIAIFRDRVSTDLAFDWLLARGYLPEDISVLMSERTRRDYSDYGTEGQIKSSTHAAEGVAEGGTLGTAIGAAVGAILALGTTVVVPGLGLVVAGPLVAAFAGGGAGAVAGGVVGGLVGMGIPESNARAYDEALKNGGVVLGVEPRTNEDAKAIRKFFEEQKADNVIDT